MMGMQQRSHSFLVLLLIVFIFGIALSGPSTPRRSRVRRQNMKVRINATGDTIVMKFLRPNSDTKLEGYILGYGSSMFSKQFIQLPENGQLYETEFDAEPKYLIAVQPIPTNDVKKHCTGKVELEKPLHLVIGSVTPTSVLLSWGTLLKTPYEGNVMKDCLEDGHYTVRYRERNRKWNYQTCPTSDTVIDHLKPNAVYEFGVQPNSKDGTGVWSKPVIHNISSGGIEEKAIRKIFNRPVPPVKPLTPDQLHFPFAPRHVPHNRTKSRVTLIREISPKTTLAPTTTTRQESLSTPGPKLPVVTTLPIGKKDNHGGDHSRSLFPPSLEIPLAPLPAPQENVENPETQPNPQLQPEHPHLPQSQPQTPKAQIKNWATTKPQQHPSQTSQSIPHTQPKMQPEQTSQSRPQTKPDSQPTFQKTPDTQPRPQIKPASNPIAELHPKPAFQPTLQTQPQPKFHPATKPIPQIKRNTQQTSQPILQTQPQPKLHPGSSPIPQTRPNPQPTSQPILQTQPQPKRHPISKPITQIKPKLQPTSQPIMQTQSQPESMPINPTKPKPQPTSKSIPQSKPQATTQLMLRHIPQSQPPPASKSVLPIKPKPHTTSQTIPHTVSQPHPQQTSHHKPQIKPKTHQTPHPNLHTLSTSAAHTKPYLQSKPKTTTRLPTEHKLQPKLQLKHQVHFQTQPHAKTMTPARVQTITHPTIMTHPLTPQPTLQHIPQTQPALLKINVKPQHQPKSYSTVQPQINTQSQPKINPQPQLKRRPVTEGTTKQQSKKHPKPKKNLQTWDKTKPKTQPNPKSQSKPQPSPQLNKQKLQPHCQPKNQTRVKQTHTNNKQLPQSQYPIKTQTQPAPHSKHLLKPLPPPKAQSKSQLDPLPKPHPTSRSQQQSQPGLQFETQSRSYSDTSNVTPRQAVATAPSPPEEGKPLPRPALATEKAGSNNQGTGFVKSSIAEVPQSPISSSVAPAGRNSTQSRSGVPPNSNHKSVRPFSPSKKLTSSQSSSSPGVGGAHHRGNALAKPAVWPREKPVQRPSSPVNKTPNLVGKPSDHDKPMDLKQGEKESILKPFPLVTAKPKQERRQQTTTSAPAVNSSRFDINENSSIFRPMPASEVDIMGKKRFVAPHVIYKTDKKPDEPCSITSSLAYFPDEEGADQNVTGPPRVPPSNLTVVTVEGCPSFVILDWQKSDNETREYDVISTTKGPNGEEVSVLTTNQTHTAVENLKPESSYEFTVTPRNELGTGPSSDPVSFNTESADPRVSENVSGKDAIWTQFPFKTDSYSECNGKQYVKRTWYRKFVGIQLCNSLRYKIYLSDSLNGKFYNIGDQTGHGEDHCQFVDSFLDGRTGTQMFADQLPSRPGFYRALRQEPVHFGEIGGKSHVTYVGWYECGTPIPGKW
ncbi:target of Nesh-SH3 isoform X2 [Labrus mixtus]|uniref:target of Nesh-SH3 isoform X2 n=1 Tax=Labrus mixtus TaxID=508554 RepID=UPI0029C0B0E9|nr:target of Nesh-SH3 isoform X2 [Labrus mixtus]